MSKPPLKFDPFSSSVERPKETVSWYVERFGATSSAEKVTRGALQISLDIGGARIAVRAKRPGEEPVGRRSIEPHSDFLSHDVWGKNYFGSLYAGDLSAFCKQLQSKGITFLVPLKRGVNGKTLRYVSAPDNVRRPHQ